MDNKFPDELRFIDAGMNGDSRLFRVEEDFHYKSPKGVIRVPKGFITDGASIPRCFWNIFDPFGPYLKIAVCHDYLYSPLNKDFDRLQSDQIFLEGMKDLKIGFIQRNLIYHSVRLFGWMFYRGFKE